MTLQAGHALLDRASTTMRTPRKTPCARALVGCLALIDDTPLKAALHMAGYSIDKASYVRFFGGRCYRPQDVTGKRVVIRNGRVVRVSRNAIELSNWMFRLGRKLLASNKFAGLVEEHARKAASS